MDVRDPVSRAPDRVRRIFLLDVRVEGIEMDPTARMPNLVHEPDGLVDRVQVIELATVDDFLREEDPRLLSVLRHSLQVVHAVLPLGFRRTSSREDAKRNLMGTTQDRRSDG